MNNLQIIKEELSKFMHDFDAENRNNRISKVMIAGMGGFLENLIMEIIQKIESQKTETKDMKVKSSDDITQNP